MHAYHALAEASPKTSGIHRLPVCYRASSLIVSRLLEDNYMARHEITTTEGIGEHSYAVLNPDAPDELLVDATWQQFLPASQANENTPKVLVGSRRDIIKQARDYGVGESALNVWKRPTYNLSVDQRQHNDRLAEDAAGAADTSGAWESFMADPRR